MRLLFWFAAALRKLTSDFNFYTKFASTENILQKNFIECTVIDTMSKLGE